MNKKNEETGKAKNCRNNVVKVEKEQYQSEILRKSGGVG